MSTIPGPPPGWQTPFISQGAPPGWQTPYMIPRSGTPPFQGAPPPMPAGYGFDQQQWAQGAWVANPLWTPYHGPANDNSWAPGPSWGMPPSPSFPYLGNPGGYSLPPARQQTTYLPPKPKQTRPPSAEYFAQPLTDNGLQLEQLVEVPDRYGDSDEVQLAVPKTPWVWNPTQLSNSNAAKPPSQANQQNPVKPKGSSAGTKASSTHVVQQPRDQAPSPRELRPTFGPAVIVTADHYKALRSRRADSLASKNDHNSGAGSVNALSEQLRRTRSDSNDPTEAPTPLRSLVPKRSDIAGGRKHRRKNEESASRRETSPPSPEFNPPLPSPETVEVSVMPPSPQITQQPPEDGLNRQDPRTPDPVRLKHREKHDSAPNRSRRKSSFEITILPPSPPSSEFNPPLPSLQTPEITVIPPSPQVTQQTPEDGKNRQASRTPDPVRRKHKEKHEHSPLLREALEHAVDSTSSLSIIPDRDGRKTQELREREEGVKRKELELIHREEEVTRKEEEAKQKGLKLARKEEEARRREEEAKIKELELIQKEEDARRRDEELREERSRFEEERIEARRTEEGLHEEIKRLEEERIAARQREQELREIKEEVERREREMVARYNQQQAKLREYEQEEIRRQAKAKEEEAKRQEAARKERNRQRTQGPSSYYPPSSSSHLSWMTSQTHPLGSPGASLFSSPISIASYSTIREEGGDGILNWQRRQEEMYRKQQEQFRKEQELLESPRKIQWSTTPNAT